MAGYRVKFAFYIMYKYGHWPHATRWQWVVTSDLSLLRYGAARICKYLHVFRRYFNFLGPEDREHSTLKRQNCSYLTIGKLLIPGEPNLQSRPFLRVSHKIGRTC